MRKGGGRGREKDGEGDERRTYAKEEEGGAGIVGYTQDTHTSEKRARVKVERNIKKHSAALEIHVI